MIRAYSAAQIREAEAPHLDAGEPLMERAAAGLADEVRRQLEAAVTDDRPGRVLMLVGTGNNGADALYAGATLADSGAQVRIVRTGERVHTAGLAAALAAGVTEEPAERAAALASESDVLVDGILGTGTSSDPTLRGAARAIVLALMPALDNSVVVAVDIPSGIDPDDGSAPDGVVLAADVTVTFGGYKAGLLIAPGSILAGRVRLIDIGLIPDLEKFEPLLVAPDGQGG